jgi:ABC-2 type transport system permease protein
MNNLVAAEWLKLRTTRLLYGTIPAAVALSLAAVAGMVLSSHGPDLETAEGMRRVFSVAGAGAVVVLVVGILISAGEYRHGTAGDTFLTSPQRGWVVTAKLAVAAALGFVIGAVTATACIAAAALVYRSESATLSLVDSDVWRTVPATAVYTALFAVLGVALGALVRNQVAAVAGALAWLAIIEHTLVNLTPSVGRWLPVGAGQAIARTPLDGLLSPSAGIAVLAAYAVVVALAGIRAEGSRDA